ncbi:MAG: FprA family A-type flavoprotein [Candidatus Aminicenantes bacterium]|nr:FprA family A-type flavoprotein [Candidatus Aminicenantes bacterium]
MKPIEIRPGIYWVGVNDQTTDLFEGLWPVRKEGVSYNSYLILDEKKVIIDLIKPIKTEEYLIGLESIIPLKEIDYIILNHLEPDHAGLLMTFSQLAPQAKFLGTAKASELISKFLKVKEENRFQIVKDGEILHLGEKSLQFFSTPFVHWPETMMTYEKSTKILFSCDAFGGFGAIHGRIFNDEIDSLEFYEQEALRYYVNIVANYSQRVISAIDKLTTLPVEIIAPSHGLIWRKSPERIVGLYKKWASYASGPVEKGITLIYGSMYGFTESLTDAVAKGIARTGIKYCLFDGARTHVSYILPSLWTMEGVIIGAPTYEVKLFPPVAAILEMARHKRIFGRKAGYFGSYGWSGGALKDFKGLADELKWKVTHTLEVQGMPDKDDLARAEEWGEQFASSLIKTCS